MKFGCLTLLLPLLFTSTAESVGSNAANSIAPALKLSSKNAVAGAKTVRTDVVGNKCQTVDVIFILDRSQSIWGPDYDTTTKDFVKQIGNSFAMTGDIVPGYPHAFGRVAVIQFSDNATLSIGFRQRTHAEFSALVDSQIGYTVGGTTNMKAALQLAVDTVKSSATTSNVLAILVTDAVSSNDLNSSAEAAAALRQLVPAFMGVEVNGINGNWSYANTSDLLLLLGNKTEYAWGTIADALAENGRGLLDEALLAYPCPEAPCKAILFIVEMTEVIGQDLKVTLLNLSRQLAQKLANSGGNQGQMRFSIAMFGDRIYKHTQLQKYADFDTTVAGLIQDVTYNDSPNGGETLCGPMLTELSYELQSGDVSNYVILFMGETEKILDYSASLNAASTVGAASNANVFVLSATTRSFSQEAVFKALVNGDSSKIRPFRGESAETLAGYYGYLLGPVFSGLTC